MRAGAGEAVGLLAGTGRFPEVLAGAVRAGGRRVVCVRVADAGTPSDRLASDRPAGDRLDTVADVVVHVEPGDWSTMLGVWQAHGVREVLIAGRFNRAALSTRLTGGDEVARGFFGGARDRRDQSLLAAFAAMLAGRGIRVAAQAAYAAGLLAPPGTLAGPPLAEGEARDIRLGLEIARVVAELDIGQTVVLKDGLILAVEAAEGTDAAVRRGGGFGPGVIVVKASRPHQDPRFDLPAIGPDTIAVMAAVRARALAVEAGRTVVLDRDALVAAAEAARITVVAVDAPSLRDPAEAGAHG